MPHFPNITLAILAGGKATRMGGRNKALLEIDGERFINRIHRNLSPLFLNTIIISNDVQDFNITNTLVFSDFIKDVGPLGGIHSALVNSINPFVFVVSCDMPLADSAIAKLLVEDFYSIKPDILIPVVNGDREPLFAVYSKHLTGKIEDIVKSTNGKAIRHLLENANTVFFNLPLGSTTKSCFTNINSLDDLKSI